MFRNESLFNFVIPIVRQKSPNAVELPVNKIVQQDFCLDFCDGCSCLLSILERKDNAVSHNSRAGVP